MTSALRRAASVALLGTALAGCPGKPSCEENGTCVDAGPPPDACNSAEEARSLAECALQAGVARTAYVSFSGDQDWYLAQMPDGLTARSLLHVFGGYAAPSTPVNFAVNVLREDGQTSLARVIDRHGQAAPKPVDLVLPFSESNARLLVLVGDEGATSTPNFDVRSPYAVTYEVVEDPDVNEPNDSTPTEVALTASGAELSGQQTGYLSTDGDVDRFTFVAPAGRKVVYLRLSAPKLTPPVAYRLSYALQDPGGVTLSEGRAENEFLPVDLTTARLTTAGTYTVVVQAYQSPNASEPPKGDLRLQYTLDLRIVDEVDANEPNDSQAQAKLLSFASPDGPEQTVTGRLGYVPDPDWFAAQLPAFSQPSVLSFRLTPTGGTGRFPPLSGVADRQLRVLTEVTAGASAADRQLACKSQDAECPKGYEGSANAQALVEALCAASDPPLCLRAERNQHPSFSALRNMQGRIPVPAHAQPLKVYVLVQDDGNNYADDIDYQLSVAWHSDPDEVARAALPQQTEGVDLPEAADFPVPNASAEFQGTLSYGYGRVLNHQLNNGEGVRGPADYDAVPTDSDRFEYRFVGVAAPEDRTWALEWELDHLPDGGLPSDVALELTFCDGDVDGGAGACAPVSSNLVLAYSSERLAPWYSSATNDRQVQWSRTRGATSTTVTAQPSGCFCVEPRFVRGGKFYVNVTSVDRNDSAPTTYRLRSSLASYPQSHTADGGTRMCPVATDGGASCRFAGGVSN